MLFFKESLNKISYISYHNYAHKFIFEYNLAYSNIDENSKYEFKKNILNEEMKILPADERELVFKHLIREKL